MVSPFPRSDYFAIANEARITEERETAGREEEER